MRTCPTLKVNNDILISAHLGKRHALKWSYVKFEYGALVNGLGGALCSQLSDGSEARAASAVSTMSPVMCIS